VKVAIIGGTGAFGRALARSLRTLGEDVYIGSRDAERARERALELGVQGGTNEDVVRGADLVVLATKSNATLETAVALADAIGETPVLCVASDLRFTDTGIVPGLEEGSLAEHVARELAGRLVGGRAIDVGPLANSRALEGMTAVILNVNKQYGVHAGLRITGLP
jgi:predicted dinucleotide-binding enzyme